MIKLNLIGEIKKRKCVGECGDVLSETEEFFYFRKSKNTFYSKCKECVAKEKKEYDKIYNENNKEKRIIYSKEYNRKNEGKIKSDHKKYYIKNKIDLNKSAIKYKEFNREKIIWNATKQRAIKLNLDFDLELSDIVIPDICPVLGIPLYFTSGKRTDNTPSIDKIDNTKGYIKSNICIISWRANYMKKDYSLEDFQKIINYINKFSNKVITND